MKTDKVNRIAAFSNPEEVLGWSSGVGKFVAALLPHMAAAQKTACGACPFRNKKSVGGCLNEDCPVLMLRKELNRAIPRASARMKDILRTKYAARHSA